MVLSKPGDHVPMIPLLDSVGNGESASPAQIGPIESNIGADEGWLTIIVKV